MKRQLFVSIGTIAAAGMLAATGGVGTAGAANSDIYDIATTAESATITLTPPSLEACNAMGIISGLYTAPVDEDSIPFDEDAVAWIGTDQLLSYDPGLSDTVRFSGMATQFPQYFTPRSITVELEPGTYSILGQCTPYDADGNFSGEDTDEIAVFTIDDASTPTEPTDPENGDDAGAWGSIGDLLPF